ncbi:9479_t:CDS:2 [Ambispora leptoticha]|uniref:9479_t:CDS:1 n=1 Tax=Ambispora leptoticha TaxID=144679 RepID=A0A9N9EII9_9GLOM|nr:9479_t:CDS:2 [Ambispora leptoticha]
MFYNSILGSLLQSFAFNHDHTDQQVIFNLSNENTGVRVIIHFADTVDQANYHAHIDDQINSTQITSSLARGRMHVISNLARKSDQVSSMLEHKGSQIVKKILVNAREYECINDIFHFLNIPRKNQIQKRAFITRKYANKWRKFAKKRRVENRGLIVRRQHLMRKYLQRWKNVVDMRTRMLKKRKCGEAFDEYEEGYRKCQRLDRWGLRYPIPQNPVVSIEYCRSRSVLKKRKLTSRQERLMKLIKRNNGKE